MSGINSSSVYSHFVEMYTSCISKIYSMIMTENTFRMFQKTGFWGASVHFVEMPTSKLLTLVKDVVYVTQPKFVALATMARA